MKLNYDSLPTFLLFAAGLFVMFASPPVVNYEGVESAGKNMPFNGEENPDYGKAYVLESDDYVDKALALTEAYSNLDKELFSSLVTEQMKPFADQMDDQESYSWKPWAMVPLRMVDENGAFVVSWSYDESVQENGSKAATHYIDVLRFNDEDEDGWITYGFNIERDSIEGNKSTKWSGYNKKDYCEKCGFKADHTVQLDVYHQDGDRKNNNWKNLKTVCANCHRLLYATGKGWKQGDLIPDF